MNGLTQMLSGFGRGCPVTGQFSLRLGESDGKDWQGLVLKALVRLFRITSWGFIPIIALFLLLRTPPWAEEAQQASCYGWLPGLWLRILRCWCRTVWLVLCGPWIPYPVPLTFGSHCVVVVSERHAGSDKEPPFTESTDRTDRATRRFMASPPRPYQQLHHRPQTDCSTWRHRSATDSPPTQPAIVQPTMDHMPETFCADPPGFGFPGILTGRIKRM